MKNSTGSKIVVMLGLIIIAAMAAFLVNKIIINQAVDKCYEHSLVRWTGTNGGQGTNFVPEWFKECMQKKGFKS
jgi:hypothetical protein